METLDQKTIKNLLKIPGEARGVILKTDGEFVLREKGQKGLKRVEAELRKLGCPIQYQKIESMAFYPLAWRVASLLIIQKVFNFDEQKIKEMGAAAPKVSLIIKLFLQYFISFSAIFKQMPRMWKKHYTVGELEPVQLNEKEKIIVIRVKDFNLHPLFCLYLCGYFSEIIKMIVKKISSCQERKCFFKKAKYHEYVLRY